MPDPISVLCDRCYLCDAPVGEEEFCDCVFQEPYDSGEETD